MTSLATELAATAKALTQQVHAAADRWWFHLDLDVLALGVVLGDPIPAARWTLLAGTRNDRLGGTADAGPGWLERDHLQPGS